MDRRAIIRKLNRVFCEASKESQRFSLVWLEGAGVSPINHSKQYILHVQAHHKIESRTQEIKDLAYFLIDKAKEEFRISAGLFFIPPGRMLIATAGILFMNQKKLALNFPIS